MTSDPDAQPITIEIIDCRCTCWACPSQFECRTRDGQHAYLRYRSGHRSVGVADDHEAAVDPENDVFTFEADDWHMELETFAAHMPPWITIATPAMVECVGWDEERIAQAAPEVGMTPRPDIEAIQRRADAAQSGPWFWRGNVDTHIRLASRGGRCGEHTVMDFVRAGMQEAVPRFNRGGAMFRADGRHRGGEDLPIFEVYPEATERKHPRVYRGDIIGLRHPDAEFIASARQDIDDLLAYVAHLEQEVATRDSSGAHLTDEKARP